MASEKKKTAKKKPAPAGKTAKVDYGKLVDLTPEEAAALQRPRLGFEKFVDSLVQVYADHVDEMGIKGLDLDELRGRFAAWTALGPVETSAAKHLEMVQETRVLNAAHVWKMLMEIYVKAQTVSRTNTDVRRAIADFQAFMKTGPQDKGKKKKEGE